MKKEKKSNTYDLISFQDLLKECRSMNKKLNNNILKIMSLSEGEERRIAEETIHNHPILIFEEGELEEINEL